MPQLYLNFTYIHAVYYTLLYYINYYGYYAFLPKVAVVVAEIQFSLAAVSSQNNTERIKFCKLNNLIICLQMILY